MQDGRGQHAGERRQRDAAGVGEGQQQGHVDAERLRELRFLGGGAKARTQRRALDQPPGEQARRERGEDDPGTVDGEHHESEVEHALQVRGHRVGLARGAVGHAKAAFEHQHQAEGEQQAVDRVQAVQAAQQPAFEHTAERTHDERHQHDGGPVAPAQVELQHPRAERPHHEESAVREIDDAQQPENDREPQAEHGIEAAVDQAQHHLTRQHRQGKTEYLNHGWSL